MSQSNTTANAGNDRLFGTLSYVVPFFLIVPLVQKQSAFAMFHAVQALTLWVAAFVATFVVGTVLTMVPLGLLGTLLSYAMFAAITAAAVFGAVQAWAGSLKPLPLIGTAGGNLFGKLTAREGN